MPCNSCGRPSGDDYEARRKIERLEAMLCALIKLTSLDGALRDADWAEAGVDGQELKRWWEEHQRRDADRRAQEALKADHERRQQEALSKLTEEEKLALGLLRQGWPR